MKSLPQKLSKRSQETCLLLEMLLGNLLLPFGLFQSANAVHGVNGNDLLPVGVGASNGPECCKLLDPEPDRDLWITSRARNVEVIPESSIQFHVWCPKLDEADNVFEGRCVCPPGTAIIVIIGIGNRLNPHHQYGYGDRIIPQIVENIQCEPAEKIEVRKIARAQRKVESLELDLSPAQAPRSTKKGGSSHSGIARGHESQQQLTHPLNEPISVRCNLQTPHGRNYDIKTWRANKMSLNLYVEDPETQMSRLVAKSHGSHGIYAYTLRLQRAVTLKCVVEGKLGGILAAYAVTWSHLARGTSPRYPEQFFSSG